MWCCVSCYFCTTRCPQQIPITDIMYTLKRLAIAEGMAKDTDAPALASTFTGFVEDYGRSFEFGLASRYYMFNKPLSMFKLVPMGLDHVDARADAFAAQQDPADGPVAGDHQEGQRDWRCVVKYAYYPGCSLESGSAAYDVSVRAVANVLGFELDELDDWNCCGATEYFSQDELVATSVIARNLAMCRPDQQQLVAPCAACFLNLKKTDHLMAEHPDDERQGEPGAGCRRIALRSGRVRDPAPAGRDLHRRWRGGDSRPRSSSR